MKNSPLEFAVLVSVGLVACHRSVPPATNIPSGPARPQSTQAIVLIQSCDTVSTVRNGPRPSLPTLLPLPSDSAGLVGTVADRQTGVALGGAVIRLGGSTSRDAVSDSVGAFSISAVPPGRYSFAAMRIGYDRFTSTIELERGGVDTMRIGLLYRACP